MSPKGGTFNSYTRDRRPSWQMGSRWPCLSVSPSPFWWPWKLPSLPGAAEEVAWRSPSASAVPPECPFPLACRAKIKTWKQRRLSAGGKRALGVSVLPLLPGAPSWAWLCPVGHTDISLCPSGQSDRARPLKPALLSEHKSYSGPSGCRRGQLGVDFLFSDEDGP